MSAQWDHRGSSEREQSDQVRNRGMDGSRGFHGFVLHRSSRHSAGNWTKYFSTILSPLDTPPAKGVSSPALKTPSEAEADSAFEFPDVPDDLLSGTEGSELNAALPAIYNELRGMASSYLRQERPNHTLQPTALVHESYMRLVAQRAVDWDDRLEVLSIAARMMRRILASYGRARGRAKRGKGEPLLELDAALDFYDQRDLSIAKVDEALRDLEAIDPRQSRVVELRFFAGLTNEEIGQVLDISATSVKREWAVAKRWLRRELTETG